MLVPPEVTALVSEISRKYLWWPSVDDKPYPFPRQVAQIMNTGGYDDIRGLESVLDEEMLTEVMHLAQPGWFSAKSWDFWRGRLAIIDDASVPIEPRNRMLPR